jgi:hypothetical protein
MDGWQPMHTALLIILILLVFNLIQFQYFTYAGVKGDKGLGFGAGAAVGVKIPLAAPAS